MTGTAWAIWLVVVAAVSLKVWWEFRNGIGPRDSERKRDWDDPDDSDDM